MSEHREKRRAHVTRQQFGPERTTWLWIGIALLLWAPVGALIMAQWPFHAASAGGWSAGARTMGVLSVILSWSLGWFIVPALVVAGVHGVRSARSPRQGRMLVLCGLVYAGECLLVDPALRWLDQRSVQAMTRRSEPLIAALDRFTAEHGHAPLSLAELVPAYLPAVPGTGWPGYPRFAYWAHGSPAHRAQTDPLRCWTLRVKDFNNSLRARSYFATQAPFGRWSNPDVYYHDFD
ncbi:MAG: hypothetical protein HZB16_19680 [Armatimonadetes bacterium]|nr:hypothetical protein [Armatimonadota bacterium]